MNDCDGKKNRRTRTRRCFFNKIKQFHSEVINPVLPGAKSRSNSTGLYNPEVGPTSFSSELSDNGLFKGSKYQYKGVKKYLHYTGVHTLGSILNNGFLRMSEFGNLLDEHEISYGASVFSEPDFKLDTKKINDLKKELFCLSFCSYSEKVLKNQVMWELYGDKGKGVSLEFKINSPDPTFYSLGKIQYGEKGLTPLVTLKEGYFKYLETGNPIANNFIELTTTLQAYHKTEYYSSEKEVRLLYRPLDFLKNQHKDPTIYSDFNGDGNVKRFKKLYLRGRHEILERNKDKFTRTEVLNLFPEIEIKRIILGPAYKDRTADEHYDILRFLKDLKYRYRYNFSIAIINYKGEIIDLNE